MQNILLSKTPQLPGCNIWHQSKKDKWELQMVSAPKATTCVSDHGFYDVSMSFLFCNQTDPIGLWSTHIARIVAVLLSSRSQTNQSGG